MRPDLADHPDLVSAVDRFAAALGDARTVAVAFSGGVDSSVTLALSARCLGRESVTAVIGVSPSLAQAELAQARETATALGVPLSEVTTHELDHPDYVANRGDRCWFCKHELYTRAFATAARHCDLLVNGDTADDATSTDRPGMRAGAELGVRSPLAEAGIGKQQVRALAKALGLAVWDKPAAPCLASRVAVDLPVTRDVLGRIERAESALHALGLVELRVRHRGAAARVELSDPDRERVAAAGLAGTVRERVLAAGWDAVDIAPTALRRA